MRDDEKMTVKPEFEADYEKYVNNNQDSYGNACVVAGAAVGAALDEGKSPQEIAQTRGLALATIYNHLTKMVEQGLCDASDIVEKDKYDEIVDYFTSTEDPRIGAAIGVLGDDYDYGEVKVVKAEFQRNGLLPPDDE